jgi:SAM-dependent methyltransferase
MKNDQTLRAVSQQLGYRSYERYKARSEFLFDGISLSGKRVLDIGCGSGAFCIWAALHGADYVLGIEPESDGSTAGRSKKFNDLIRQCDLKNTELKNCYIQELPIPEKKYDVILLFNVINHLNEEAVKVMHQNTQAYNQYKDIINGFAQFMNKDSVLILGDCARTNMWPMLGLKNPFVPTIEWHKHQNPSQWIKLFKEAGFRLHDFRWSPLYSLGKLSSNWPVHFLTASHFVLRFKML